MAGNVLRFKAKAAMQSCCNLGIKLAVAESCTGGLLSEALTALPGSSAFFDSGYITYSNSAKIEMLGVPANLLARFGAVSPEVACAMAEGALSHAKADASLGITGIAGPTGGSTEKPVGTVHIACASQGNPTQHRRLALTGDRKAVRQAAACAALDLLQDCLLRPNALPDPFCPPVPD